MLPASAPGPLAPHQRLASKTRQECRRLLTPTVLRGYGMLESSLTLKTPQGRDGTAVQPGALAAGPWSPLHLQHRARLGWNKDFWEGRHLI